MKNNFNYYETYNPDLKNKLISYAKNRSKINFFTCTTPLIILILFGSLSAILDIMILADLIFGCFDKPMPAGIIIATSILNSISILTIVYLVIKRRRLLNEYYYVLLNGQRINAYIKEVGLDWQVQINNTPRSFVDMVIDGRNIRIKTFSPEILNYCKSGAEIAIIWHKDMPHIIIPAEGINEESEEIEPETFIV